MIRWLAAAIIVIVHRWKIVVDKGICMDHLNGASDWKRGITVAASGLACRNDKRGRIRLPPAIKEYDMDWRRVSGTFQPGGKDLLTRYPVCPKSHSYIDESEVCYSPSSPVSSSVRQRLTLPVLRLLPRSFRFLLNLLQLFAAHLRQLHALLK